MAAAATLTGEAAAGTAVAVGAAGVIAGTVVVGGIAYGGNKIGNKLADDYANDPTQAKEIAASEARFNNAAPRTDIGHYAQLSKLTQQAGLKGNPSPEELETAIIKKREALGKRSGISEAWDYTKSIYGMRGLVRDQTPAEKERAEIQGMSQELILYKKENEKAATTAVGNKPAQVKTAAQAAVDPHIAEIVQNLKSHGAEIKDSSQRQQIVSAQSAQQGRG
jgi:hypothetical protein